MKQEKMTLKALRVNKKLTQQQAADAMEVNINSVRKWENGTAAPTQRNIEKICEVYNTKYENINFLSKD